MTSRETQMQRRRAAGLAYVEGWLPAKRAAAIAREIEAHRAEAERAANTPLPMGRPKKADQAGA